MILSYVLSIVIQYSGNMDFLRILSPLSYFEGLSVVKRGIEMLFVIISAIIVVGLICVSIKRSEKKDLIIFFYRTRAILPSIG